MSKHKKENIKIEDLGKIKRRDFGKVSVVYLIENDEGIGSNYYKKDLRGLRELTWRASASKDKDYVDLVSYYELRERMYFRAGDLAKSVGNNGLAEFFYEKGALSNDVIDELSSGMFSTVEISDNS
jgi:hypothetical protein